MFFVLNFLAATQDIIVDGWALSMLKRFDFIGTCRISFYIRGVFENKF